MNLTPLRGNQDFWNRFAPWYEKWLTRGTYHRPIVKEISQMIEPGWKILDIGAGTGVLSLPMATLGCGVLALEPSEGMRNILSAKLSSLRVQGVDINTQRWEEFDPQGQTFDLLIACNSLHLTIGGLAGGMKKVFSSDAGSVALITEINQDIFIDFKAIDSLQSAYAFLFIKKFTVDSSFHFEDQDEVKEVEAVLGAKLPVIMEEERLVQHDSTDIAVVWWERK
ncbi:MAG: class I SAM-dependent methyltransferase [bacterium]